MPAKVTLKVVAGEMQGQELVFDERTTCIIGRAKDCSPEILAIVHVRILRRHRRVPPSMKTRWRPKRLLGV